MVLFFLLKTYMVMYIISIIREVINIGNCIATKHSKERCKERLGLSKSCINKKAEKAQAYGIRYHDTSGSLKKYMGYLYSSHKGDDRRVIIYNRDVYIFKDNIIITIFHIPKQYQAACDKIQRKKIEKLKEND